MGEHMELHGAKVLETTHLILRPFKKGDELDMHKNYCSDALTCKYLTWYPHKNIQETKKFLHNILQSYKKRKHAYTWAIVLKETQEVIGCVDTSSVVLHKKKAGFGYVLGKNYWNKGYMTEAVKAVINYLFEEGFERIEAWCKVLNIASARVLEKAGMTFEGTLRKYDCYSDGTLCDVNMFSIIR